MAHWDAATCCRSCGARDEATATASPEGRVWVRLEEIVDPSEERAGAKAAD
jgi:hypothetical protein